MTPHQVLAVAARLFAIWLAIQVVRDVAIFSVFSRDRGDPQITLAIVMSVVASVALVVLWFFPKSIAGGLVPSPSSESPPPASPDGWLTAGSALIGLWLVASAAPSLLRNGLGIVFLYGDLQGGSGPVTQALAFYSIQTAVGLALIFGANGVRRFLTWAR